MHCPSLNVLGTFFPAWMLCALLGLAAAIVAYRFVSRTRLRDDFKPELLAYHAAEKSYASGLATLTDAMNAQKARALASVAKEQAFADALIATVTLSHASGELISARAVPRSP
jgi:hypothetical protein